MTQIPVKSKNFVVAYNWNTVSPYYIFDINPGISKWMLYPGVSSPFCMWLWQKKIPFSHTFYWKRYPFLILSYQWPARIMNKSLKRKPCHFHVVIQPYLILTLEKAHTGTLLARPTFQYRNVTFVELLKCFHWIHMSLHIIGNGKKRRENKYWNWEAEAPKKI